MSGIDVDVLARFVARETRDNPLDLYSKTSGYLESERLAALLAKGIDGQGYVASLQPSEWLSGVLAPEFLKDR